MKEPEDDEVVYICIRVGSRLAERWVGPTLGVFKCRLCDHPVWANPTREGTIQYQCIECTPRNEILEAGLDEDGREHVAEVMGLSDDEITDRIGEMAREYLKNKETE